MHLILTSRVPVFCLLFMELRNNRTVLFCIQLLCPLSLFVFMAWKCSFNVFKQHYSYICIYLSFSFFVQRLILSGPKAFRNESGGCPGSRWFAGLLSQDVDLRWFVFCFVTLFPWQEEWFPKESCRGSFGLAMAADQLRQLCLKYQKQFRHNWAG